jgi:hypothetical protein
MPKNRLKEDDMEFKMSFEIFGALMLWGIGWFFFPRTSFVLAIYAWLNAAHPYWKISLPTWEWSLIAIAALVWGLILDIGLLENLITMLNKMFSVKNDTYIKPAEVP